MRTPHLQLFLCCFFSRHNGLFLWRLSFCLPFCWVTERPLIFNHRLKLRVQTHPDLLETLSVPFQTRLSWFSFRSTLLRRGILSFLWCPFLPAFSRAANKLWSRFIVTCCVSKGRSPGSSIVTWDHVREKVLAESKLKQSHKFLSTREATAMQIYSSQKHKCITQPHCEAAFYNSKLWKIISFFSHIFCLFDPKFKPSMRREKEAIAIWLHCCVSCPIVEVINNSVISKQTNVS